MIRTLVVDDDFRVADIHAAYVQRVEGFEIVGKAHSATAALHAVEESSPDLLLLDLYLPDAHGLDLVRRLRRQGQPAVDVMAITAAKDAGSVRDAMQVGVLHYLLKPFTFATLRDKLLSYARMRAQLAMHPETDQTEVDRIFATLHRDGLVQAVNKGRSVHTLDTVERLVAASRTGVTTLQVARSSGMSRATAQRYLSHLESRGRVAVELLYGSAGRPEHVYRWVAGPSGPPLDAGSRT